MFDMNKVYDGDSLEVLVNHVIVGGFISNDTGIIFGDDEQLGYLKTRQYDGEKIYTLLNSGIGSKQVKSYALLAVIRMMQRDQLAPMTVDALFDFLAARYVGEFRNVAAFAQDLAKSEAVAAGTQEMYSRVVHYVDWTEFTEDHYDKDYWFVSVNDHRRLPEGPVFVFKKEQ